VLVLAIVPVELPASSLVVLADIVPVEPTLLPVPVPVGEPVVDGPVVV